MEPQELAALFPTAQPEPDIAEEPMSETDPDLDIPPDPKDYPMEPYDSDRKPNGEDHEERP
jgi:hypothetical protein